MRLALALLLTISASATPFKLKLPAPELAAASGNSGNSKSNGNGNGNGSGKNSTSGNSNSGNNSGSNSGGSGSSGSNASASPLLYSNSFINGRGSYQGGLLIGETLQSQNGVLQSSGDSSELIWVESLISGNLPTFPGDFLSTGSDLSSSSSSLTYSYTLAADVEYGYFMAKWGKSDNSSDHAVWLLQGGQTLQFQLPNGLSHSKLWFEEEYVPAQNPVDFTPQGGENSPGQDGDPTHVPDGGSTALLLLGALLPCEYIRRRRR